MFALAIFEFITAGFNAFAIVCCLPLVVLLIYLAFGYQMMIFWALIFINYFVQFFGK